MNDAHINQITSETGYAATQVSAVAALLLEGATVPFISRYRKEATGSLDEVAVTFIRDRLGQMADLDARRETVLKSLDQHGHLTDELRDRVQAAETLSELEDIYLPYRPKRRTKATMAKEKGLEPLAETLFSQSGANPEQIAADFVDTEKGVDSVDDALAGARDIMAEWVSENPDARAALRRLFENRGSFCCTVATGKEAEAAKYKDYFDWREPVATAPSHRILAMRRGEKEDLLNLTIAPDEQEAVALLEEIFLTGDGPDADQVRLAVTDSYKRLLSRSMETEIRLATKERADIEAIRVFADNLRQLLLAPPLGAKRIMALDPGFRTGCKLVCLDRQGKLLHNSTVYPHTSGSGSRAAETVQDLAGRYGVEAIAVGNGTAGRETETFLRQIDFSRPIPIVMVNESGASIYSASEAARKEFPDHDLTVRGAVSIGRRLMDPLSELVKIDPKSIGVGQYQHDVDPVALKQSLDDVVASCVNGVGVEVNRASVQLLTYVSGLGPRLAANIVAFRDENGPFESRQSLKQVPRLGPKAFEQAAGFLRINDGDHPLDASAVHPESYHIVDTMAADLSCTVGELLASADLRKKIEPGRYVTDTVGLPTLRDILSELAKPGRDPREEFEVFSFASGIEKPADLRQGMRLPGIVTNITAFGAFVDVGVHQDGLVHVSQMADRFVRNPADVVKVAQKVDVTVLEVDLERNRISLSMKSAPETGGRSTPAAAKKSVRKKKQPPPAKAKATPFNNPFADAFGKKSS